MAKSIVFVFHGMGEYKANWIGEETSVVQALRKAAKQYAFFQGQSLDSYVEFVPILYDDVFERILQHWDDQATALTKAIPVMPDRVDKILAYLGDSTEEKWWLKTGLDVLLYWWFRLFQQRVVLRVLAQMTERIAKTAGSNNEYSFHVLAHSLGTAVAHDALHHLGTEKWLQAYEHKDLGSRDLQRANQERAGYTKAIKSLEDASGVSNPFHPRLFGFDSITMLANVSPRISVSEDPYASIVRPGSALEDNAYARVFINVGHKYDPFAAFGGFKMPLGWEPGGLDLEVKHLDGDIGEIHDASHYVAHPFVHLRLLKRYVNPFEISQADVDEAKKYDRRKSLTAQAATDALAGGIGDLTGFIQWIEG